MQQRTSSSKSVRAVPEGFHTVTAYLIVDGAAKLIEFINQAFDGKTTFITKMENDRVMHATVQVGNSLIMISDTMEGMEPQTAMLYLYLDDADATFKKAIAAKATALQEPRDEFYGDRAGAVKDAFGNIWWIATHIEDVDNTEMERRAKEFLKERKEKGDEVHA
jgi:PhnB protein